MVKLTLVAKDSNYFRIVLKSRYMVQAMSNTAMVGINYGACFHFVYVVCKTELQFY